MSEAIFAAAREALERGEPVALVTIVRTQGSTPQRVGAKMLVFADGRTVGTIGGGCYEHDALGKAREALAGGPPRLVSYELSDDLAEETGLICGGRMDVFIEPLEASPHLYLIGAGHVSRDLARAAHDAGFRVTVVDDREKFASPERFPDAEVVVDAIPDWVHRVEIPASAFVVILTRGHRHDLEALRALAARDLRYLGLIGSRAKVTRLFEALAAEGMPAECLRRVFAPIGLDIGAVTPAEIAVSILAEMIALRRGRLAAEGTEAPATARSMRHTPKALAQGRPGL
jgi:xanthine dehydrogenase accessory factor